MTTELQVLVVDDDPVEIDGIKQALGPLDLEIFSAQNGDDALAVIRSQKQEYGFCGIVVTDMPIMDGWELLQQACVNDAKIPIIVITDGGVTSAVAAIRGGAFDYIERPIQPKALRAQVTEALRVRRQVLDERRGADAIRPPRN